jgi:hypothetical protein
VVLFSGKSPATHIPSLILAAILLVIGVQLWVLGLIADLMAVNRKLLEDIQVRIRQAEYEDPTSLRLRQSLRRSP